MSQYIESLFSLNLKLIFSFIFTAVCCYIFSFTLLRIELSKEFTITKAVEDIILTLDGSEEDQKQNRFVNTSKINRNKKNDCITSADADYVKTNDVIDNDEKICTKNKNIKVKKPKSVGYRRHHLEPSTKTILYSSVIFVTLFVYLLLVFVPGGSVILSFIGVLSVMVAFLKSQIVSEFRLGRFDRLSTLITLVLFTAACLCFFTYARYSLLEGVIYEGSARIVGYSDESYNNMAGDKVRRTDLEVAWGGNWACRNFGKQCQSHVNGALCEVEKQDDIDQFDDDGSEQYNLTAYKSNGDEDSHAYTTNNRKLKEGRSNDDSDKGRSNDYSSSNVVINDKNSINDEDKVEVLEEEVEDLEEELEDTEERYYVEKEIVDELEEEIQDVDEIVDEVSNAYYEELAYEDEILDENDKLYYANEDLYSENIDLYYKNKELEDELEELESDLDEARDSSFGGYIDDSFSDDYWKADWSRLWGDYACSDLFETDLESMDYSPDESPGNDGWPVVNIVGKCNTCEAFLLDYYSTMYFANVASYQTRGINYAIAGSASFLLTLILYLRQSMFPVEDDKDMELITSDGGVAV